MLEEILRHDNLQMALDHLLKGKDGCGIDGMRLSDLPAWLELNEELFVQSVRDGSYSPEIVELSDVLNYRGKIRPIAKIAAKDRLLLRAIHQVLSVQAAPLYSSNSYAFCENRGLLDAVKKICQYVDKGDNYVVELDVENCFGNISHQRLLGIIKSTFHDMSLTTLIAKYLRQPVSHDFEIYSPPKGILQGSPISPVLCNLYFCAFDRHMTDACMEFVRFADDIKVFADDYAEALEIYHDIRSFLTDELLLPVSEGKSGVFPVLSRVYLGYELKNTEHGIEAVKHNRLQQSHTKRWRSSALEKRDDSYYILSGGILTKRDYTVLFENEEKKVYLPANVIDSINVYSSVTFGSNFFKAASDFCLSVSLFDSCGEYLGVFTPASSGKSAHTMLNQALAYKDISRRLLIARQMTLSSIHNIRANLRYYQKHRPCAAFEQAILNASDSMKEANEAESIQALMLVEARVRSSYYELFNDILPDPDFKFIKRTKRPPKDAINALISFGNTILYNTVATEIHKTSLDIRISYVHSSERRIQNLNLDIADYLKPVITDRLIFTLINKEILHEQEHFETMEDRVYLNKTGKSIFLKAYAAKLNTVLTVDGRQMTYQGLIGYELSKLIRHINQDEKYQPFRYQ